MVLDKICSSIFINSCGIKKKPEYLLLVQYDNGQYREPFECISYNSTRYRHCPATATCFLDGSLTMGI